MRLVGLLLVGCLVIVPVSLAQDEGAGVLVRDPRGDARMAGVPLPAGADAFDLIEISVVDETAESIVLRLAVAALPAEAPPGEVGAHFRLGSGWWVVGWTTVPFPSPPFHYRGGFYCPSDSARRVDPATCDSFAGRLSQNAYWVTMNRASLAASNMSATLDQLRGYADLYNGDGLAFRFDETPLGRAYVFATGEAASEGTTVNATAEAQSASSTTEASDMVDQTPRGNAAGPQALIVLVAILLAFAIRLPRRSDGGPLRGQITQQTQ